VQESFDFAAEDLGFIRNSLVGAFIVSPKVKRREPVWQLVRSLIGSQTYDDVAEGAFKRLRSRWPNPRDLADAAHAEVLRSIVQVKHAGIKAVNLVATLQWIGRERPDYDLSFLKSRSVHEAMLWLERFPGVADKVAAATLNASTLAMPVFIVDCHVHRILLRFGFIGSSASARRGRDAVTAAAESWTAPDLLELFAVMKRLGQTVCRPFRPRCGSCPLASRCSKKTWLGVPKLADAAASRSKPFAFPRPDDHLVLTKPSFQLSAEI
jgi:endonuclease III